MIKSKEDLFFYIKEDAKANIRREKCSWFRMKISLWYGLESYMALNYLIKLHHYEYELNRTDKSLLSELQFCLSKVRWHRLCKKYRFRINPNVVGYGLRIPHITGGGIIGADKIGNNCIINCGVVIGTKTGTNKRPVIGNNCEITIGACIVGDVHIGNNVIVAPNSVVVKDVPDNAVVSGVPAKILKINGEKK